MTRRYFPMLVLLLVLSSILHSQSGVWLNGTSAFGGASNSGAIFSLDREDPSTLEMFSFHGFGPLIPYGAPLLASDGMFYATTYQGGDYNRGTVIQFDNLGNEPAILFQFDSASGELPTSSLIEGVDGRLYGTTSEGGSYDLGVVFSITKDGSTLSILHHFNGEDGHNPWAGVVQGSDGMIYGTTVNGGLYDSGVLFRIGADGNNFEVLHEFTPDTEGSESYCQLVEDTDGYFYGTLAFNGATGAGGVFKIKNDGSDFSIIKSFGFSTDEGSSPMGNLTLASNGKLYGTTFSGGSEFKGTIFSIEKNGTNFENIRSFIGLDGERTFYANRLLEHSDGYFYGTTIRGGTSGRGTIFKLNMDGSDFSVIGEFDGENGELAYTGLVTGPDDSFYGFTILDDITRFGLFYGIKPDGSEFQTVFDFTSANATGGAPSAGLVESASGMFGTATYGGENGFGTIINSGGQVWHAFSEGDGKWPWGELIYTDATDQFYGTCISGGDYNRGTIFRMDDNGENFEVIYHFTELTDDGAAPRCGLLMGSDGMLYGCTTSGGEYGRGSVFRVAPDGTAYTQLASFDNDINGASPSQTLIEGSNGKLYGVTTFGGELSTGSPSGTAFSLDKDGGNFEVLHVFDTEENGSPSGPLLEKNGYLYGTTNFGAAFESGSIYRFALEGSSFEMVHEFMPIEGVSPRGALVTDIVASSEWIYGVTRLGGEYGYGTVFRFLPDGSQLEVYKSFTGAAIEPAEPNGGLIWDYIVKTNEFPKLDGISVSPNPTAGEFQFIWEHDFPTEKKAELIIVDEKGNQVFRFNGKMSEVNSALSPPSKNWSNGSYFIHLKIDGKYFSETLLLVK